MPQTWQTIEQAAVSLRLSVRTVNRHIVAGKLESRLNEGRREVLVDVPETPAVEAPASPFSFDANVSAASAAVTDTGATAAGAGGSDGRGATDTPAHASHDPSSSPFSQAPSPPVSIDPETVLALADNAAQKAELAVAAYQTLARQADTQMHQMRRTARAAWAAVAVMAVGVSGAIGWTTHRLTRASAERDYLQDKLIASTDDVRKLSAAQDALRSERTEAERTLRAELTARQDEIATQRAAAEQALRTDLASAREHAARAEGQLAAYKEQEVARQAQATVAAAATVPPAPPAGSAVPSIFTLDTTAIPSAVEASAREAADRTVTQSVNPTTQPSPSRRDDVRTPAPATRPAPLRRKARGVIAPTTRPAPATDTTSASTAEERPLR